MAKFGEIKSKIENTLVENYGKKGFKSFFKGFKIQILSNKNLSEAYFLYDSLSSKKGFSKEMADEYLNSSVEKLKEIFQKEDKNLVKLNEWINKVSKEKVENDYADIDTVVYMNNSVKNLEKLVESSLRIKKLISDKSEVKETKTINLPLSSMIKVGTNIFNNRFSDITESEKKELNNILSMDKKTLETQINESKKNVIEKLKSTLNESEDKELHNKIHDTIEKINDSEISFLTLYRIKELEKEI
jgi:hypothetical protein